MDRAALAGVRIADFAWAWAGAHAGTLLAFLGAEVIKIESLIRPDFSRTRSLTTGQKFEGLDQSAVFNDINLGKLSVRINLGHPRGLELAKAIVQISDVVTQNWRPGAMELFGLGYKDLSEVKPDIIYLSSSAQGMTGPEGRSLGLAPDFAAIGGLSYITGYADGPPTELAGEIDLLSAYTSAFAILAALNYRQQSGYGQHIDTSSSEAISVLIGEVLMDYTMNGRVQCRQGNRDEFMAPHNCYRCRGEDKWVSIAVGSDEEWRAFTNAIGNPEWTEYPSFSDAHSRWRNQQQLDKLVEDWTLARSHYEVMEILQQAGVAAVPSFNSQELYSDPHLKERRFWQEIEHPIIGRQTVAGPPWKLSATPARVYRHGPLLGEHNEYVFGELLGLPSDEIIRLVEEKVIY